MKILIIGSGTYVIGDKTENHGTILPALIKFYREVNSNIELYIYSKSPKRLTNFKKKIKFFNFDIKKFKFYSSDEINFNSLLEKNIFDLSIVCVPDHLHFLYLKKLLLKNVNTLVVKPFVLKLNQAKYLAELEKKNNLICRVEHHKRYDPSNFYLKQQIKNKKFGKINHILVQYSQSKEFSKVIFKSWFNKTNIINYLGIHYLDLVLFITGYKPKLINNLKIKNKNEYVGNILNINWTGYSNGRKESFIQTLLLNMNEPINTPVPSRQKINLLFEKGRIDIDQDFRGISSLSESGNLEYINPQFSKIYEEDGKIIYGYGIESIFNYMIKVNNKVSQSDTHCLDLNPSFAEASKLIHILERASK